MIYGESIPIRAGTTPDAPAPERAPSSEDPPSGLWDE
jgi:hypothetical protein